MADEIGYEFSEVDETIANEAFQRGLKAGTAKYLDDLEKRLIENLDQDEIDKFYDGILGSFEALKKHLTSMDFQRKPEYYKVSVNTLVKYGLNEELLSRTRVFCVQIDSMSPTAGKPSVVTFDSPDESFAAQLSKSGSVDYDEDFEIDDDTSEDGSEDIHEIDESVTTEVDTIPQDHSASFLQRSIKSAGPLKVPSHRPITTSSPRDRSMTRYSESQRQSRTSITSLDVSRPKTTGAAITRTRKQMDTVNMVTKKSSLLARVNQKAPILSMSTDPSSADTVDMKIPTESSSRKKGPGEHDAVRPTSSERLNVDQHIVKRECDLKTPPRAALSSSSATPPRRMYDGGGVNAIPASVVSTSVTSSQVVGAGRMRSGSKHNPWIKKKQWRLGPKVGSGSFGDVFQGVNDMGQLFAVKRLATTSASDIDNLIAEIEMMKSMEEHMNIVQYLGADFDEKDAVLYIFQTWVPAGSVAEMLTKFGPFPVAQVRTYTRHILTGLSFLHQNEIVHRDIKGGNILVDDQGNAKIADFGCSSRMQQGKTVDMTTIKGTPFFMAPEVLNEGKYGRKGDVWAVGCTVIQMLTGKPPWSDKGLVGMQGLLVLSSYLKNLKGIPSFDWPTKVPECQALRAFLQRCFEIEVEKRSRSEELLTDEFLLDEDFEDSGTSLNASLGNTHTELELIRSKMHNAVRNPHEKSYPDLHDNDGCMSTDTEIQARISSNSKPLPALAAVVSPIRINPASASNPFSARSRKAGQPFSPAPIQPAVIRASVDSEDESELSVIPSSRRHTLIQDEQITIDVPRDPFRPVSEIPRDLMQVSSKGLDETIEEEPITIEVSPPEKLYGR